jgi:hypothetical protein
MKRSSKVVLASIIGIVAVVSALAVATHLRESVEDAGKKAPENESPTQALTETLNGGESGANEQGENNGANEATEQGK